MPKVRKIHVRPLVSSIIQQGMDGGSDGLRVAAYARVSTTLDEQNNSFQAQKDYYEKLINKTMEKIILREAQTMGGNEHSALSTATTNLP